MKNRLISIIMAIAVLMSAFSVAVAAESYWDAQKAYCERTKAPLFASQRCFSCGQDIFAPEGKAKSGPLGRQWFTGKTKAGISIEEAEVRWLRDVRSAMRAIAIN